MNVSVIIPAYNVVHCIGRAIESVLKQTVLPLEIIVVDDGSNDNLERFLADRADALLRYHRQSNTGAASARNYGVSLSSGELIAFLDADDFWYPQKLERQLAAFTDIDDLGLCYTGCNAVQYDDVANSTMKTDVDCLLQGIDTTAHLVSDFSSIFVQPYFGTPGVMLKRACFDEVGGFNKDLMKAEDVDLWLRFAYRYKIAYIPAPLWVIVVRPDGLSSSGGVGGFADNLSVIDCFCREHPEFAHTHQHVVKEAVRNVYMQWGRAALANNKPSESRTGLWSAFKIKPSMEIVYLYLKSIVMALRAKKT